MFTFLGVLVACTLLATLVMLTLKDLPWSTKANLESNKEASYNHEQALKAILELSGSTTCGQASAFEQAQQIAAQALNTSRTRS